MKIALKNLQARKEALGEIAVKPAPHIKRKATAELDFFLSMWIEYVETDRALNRTRAFLDKIDQIMQQLDTKQACLLRYWYFDKCPRETMLEKMSVKSLATLYNLRNKAVTNFCALYFCGCIMYL